jgi:hypothetical protein
VVTDPNESQTSRIYDPSNPVVAWCVHGMEREGTPHEALASFERAWALRRDDYDACIAAHFMARHQPTAEDTVGWNRRALLHALASGDARLAAFMASLHLNLGDSLLAIGARAEATEEARQARLALASLDPDGYGRFVTMGVERLEARLRATDVVPRSPSPA